MKRFAIFVSLVLFVSIGSIFADGYNLTTTNNSFGFTQFNMMGNNLFGYGSFLENNEISNTPDLTLFASGDASKAENEKWTGALLNFFLGWGIGSFVQGDTTGGIIGLAGDGAGLVLEITGLVQFLGAAAQSASQSISDSDGTSTSSSGLAFVIIGGVVLSASRIFQLVRPFTYANSFSAAVVPTFDNNGRPAMTVAINFKY